MKEKTIQQISRHRNGKKYTVVTRKIGKTAKETSRGYILNFSKSLILLQETDDFKVLGYNIFPLKQIVSIRHNSNDEFYDTIMKGEKEHKNIGIKYKVNLNSWTDFFQSLKTRKLNVIIECENPDDYSFDLGIITDIKKSAVHLKSIDAQGNIDKESYKFDFKIITKVMFDDRYINTLSKYATEEDA